MSKSIEPVIPSWRGSDWKEWRAGVRSHFYKRMRPDRRSHQAERGDDRPGGQCQAGHSVGARVEFANSLRGVAAISVVFYHYAIFWLAAPAQRALANVEPIPINASHLPGYVAWLYRFPDARMLQGANWLHHLPQLDWGAFGVALFFVISGFVIPLSFDTYDVKGFLLGRIMRIYPTYIAGFTLTVAAMATGGLIYNNPFPFSSRDVFIHYIPGLRDVMGTNVIDPVIWTLEVELKFYVLCCFLAHLFRIGSLRVFLAPLTLASLAACITWLAPQISPLDSLAYQTLRRTVVDFQYIIFMFVGVALSYRWRGRLSSRAAGLAIVALYGMFVALWFLAASPTLLLRGQEFSRVWSYAAAAGLFSLAMRYPKLVANRTALRVVADVSYPLYIIHMAAGFLLMRLLYGTGLPIWAIIAIAAGSAISVSWVLHRLVELPTRRIGQSLAKSAAATRPLLTPISTRGNIALPLGIGPQRSIRPAEQVPGGL
jgi:peptidoglycan/LPS O-acetylase OafA/YrhL